MAWIYLVESAESVSHSSLGCELSLIVNKTDTLSPYYFQGNLKESCTELQSGMTCKRSLETCCRQLTLSLEVSLARTSASLIRMQKAWGESVQDFSSKLSDLQKKLVRRLCSSKTSQQLELEDFVRSSEHLPKSGMTVAGLVYLPQALERRISANDGSYWPTPTASTSGTNGKSKCPETGKWINGRPSLYMMAARNLWPTPLASDAVKMGHGNLSHAAKFATPQARDFRSGQKSRWVNPARSRNLNDQIGGQLNPTWVEWLMGYPLGHTELNALGIQWFQRKQEKRSKSYQDSETRMEFPA